MQLKKTGHLEAVFNRFSFDIDDGGNDLQAIDLEASEGSAGAGALRAQLPRLSGFGLPLAVSARLVSLFSDG